MSRLVGDAVINLLAYKSSGSASSPWQPMEQEMKSDMKSLTKESRMQVTHLPRQSAGEAEKIKCVFFYLLLRSEYSCHGWKRLTNQPLFHGLQLLGARPGASGAAEKQERALPALELINELSSQLHLWAACVPLLNVNLVSPSSDMELLCVHK